MDQRTERTAGNPLAVSIAWVVVMIPLLWGVYNTALNTVKLFR
jgi:hypothetical protein